MLSITTLSYTGYICKVIWPVEVIQLRDK